ncbi:MAG: hypothetical protein E6960_12225 [Clostridium sp.]|uniref:hypothetical protein n=1 Tax=Clostridium sp. TaxID=1506 RepID=UPI002904AC6A|nr:hypothetical protein [Clostridium sp.]MDU1279235.1 hypothetical protein [Clostridium sp.]
MDDHMLDRIKDDIKLCFMLVQMEEERETKFNIKEDLNYKAASVLISAYNKLVELYYLPEYRKTYSISRVDIAYKNYKYMQ